MATTTDLSTLKINYLTQEQYDTALANGQINSDELYLTPSSPIDTQILSRPEQLNGLNDNTLQTLVSTSRADRLMFLPADQIIIEKTTDGGTTWTDAGISDTTKTALFSETRPSGITIPLLNNVKNVNCGLRITITAMKYNVPSGTAETAKYNYWNSSYISAAERYSNLKELYLWVNTNSDGLSLKVESAKGNASTTWVTVYDSGSNFALTGWAGCDYIKFSQQQLFGGSTSQTGQYWNYRFTFFTRNQSGGTTLSTNSSYTGTAQSILEIRGYGDSVWRTPNNFMANDHIYTWDQDQNVTFPASVYGSTAATGTNNTQLATTAFVQTALQNVDSLPSQSGNSGKYLTTNGTTASWGTILSSCKIYTATCSTAAATAAKVATLDDSSDFSLTAGVMVAVRFTYGNSATTPTLRVDGSSTGTAKTIAIPSSVTAYTTGNGTTYNTWGAYESILFTYTGTYWVHIPSGYLGYLSYNLANAAVPKTVSGAQGNWSSTITNSGDITFNAYDYTEGSNTLEITPNSTTIHKVVTPTANGDAVPKSYVDNKITYGTTDLTAGSSALTTGTIYLVYE